MKETTINCALLGCEAQCPCETFASGSDGANRCVQLLARRLSNAEQVAGVWRKSYETAEAERVALDAAFRALALRLAELERRAFTTQIDADVGRRLQRDEARDEAEARR
jgi:hypothetical protein